MESTKTIIVNVVVTFVQAGFATWIAMGGAVDKLAIGAVTGAGASAVWNMVLKPLLKDKGYLM